MSTLISTLILVWIVFLTYYLIQQRNRDLVSDSGTPIPFGADDFTAKPAPGRTGPFKVCVHDYDFSPNQGQWLLGRIYAPVRDEETCVTRSTPFNLVLIAHADGQGSTNQAHTNYDGLARHLASNALMVVSFNRYGLGTAAGAIDIFDQVLGTHLDYLYNSSPIKDFITNNVALIGHSAGGRSVLRFAEVVQQKGKKLKALIALASTINLNEDYTLVEETDAFLGINITFDNDENAWGPKANDQVMGSTFKAYDDAGTIADEPNTLSLEKDMVFVDTKVFFVPEGSHYFQNQPFALAYINAFLQLHLNGHSIFRRFFKFQQKPSSLDLSQSQIFGIWQQHAEKNRLVLANFENDDITVNTLNGSIQLSAGIENPEVGEAYIIDEFSPHNTKVLKFDLNVENNNAPKLITFGFNEPTDLNAFGYLSFRATQVYHPDNNPSGTPKDFIIRLQSPDGNSEVNISDFGGALHFPVIVSAPSGVNLTPPKTPANGQTKNAMRSYLIPLREFTEVNFSAVTELTIDFSDCEGKTTLIFDDIEFYRL